MLTLRAGARAPVTVAFRTLGCRLNQVESQEMLGMFERRGFGHGAEDGSADVYVVNTCTVTGRADVSDRQIIRRIAREHPGAILVVTGCYAQTDAEAVARIPGVDLVVGNQEKYRLAEMVESLLGRARTGRRPAEISVAPISEARPLALAPFTNMSGRSRAFVKVQDGCQHRCAFCIVPAARGGSRSQEPRAVLDQVRALVEAGYREVTLTGVDMGHYGWDLVPRSSLAELVRQVSEVRGLGWLRLSSILPGYFTPALLEVLTQLPVVAPHLHVPLQSGSDRVLRMMRRPYNTRMYLSLVERLERARPGLGLGTDLIVGHPGERDEDFRQTMELVRALPFSYLHVFSYSDRKGTEAARRANRVPPREIAERSRELRALGLDKSLAFRRGLLGGPHEVLVLEARDRGTGLLSGLTANYAEVLFEGPGDLARRFVDVAVTEVSPERTVGVLEAASARTEPRWQAVPS